LIKAKTVDRSFCVLLKAKIQIMKARFLRLITTLLSLLLLNFPAFSQSTPKYILGPGEYNCWVIPTASHQVYDLSTGVPSLVQGQPSVVTAVSGNLHHQCVLDNQGNVYCWGDNSVAEIGNGVVGGSVATPLQISVDSLGNPFNNIVQVYAGGSSLGYLTAALKGDGTVWVWGTTSGGNRGNGTWGGTSARPVQVPFPAGTVIKKIAMNNIGIALDANGNIWTWGGASQYATPWLLGQGTGSPDITTPHTIALPSPASDFSGGGYTNYALLANGQLYGWGYNAGYLGTGSLAPGFSPISMNPILGFTQSVKSVAVNNESTYAILADGTLWSWGDNACGSVGNGVELNYANYVNASGQASPYAWDWGSNELIVSSPVQIGKGISNFTNIWTGMGDVFYCYAEDANGQLYSWGRNKYGVLGNGVGAATGTIGASYPNSWDVPWITAIDPFSIKAIAQTSSPYCVLNPGGSPCNGYTIPGVAAPVANAGPNQNISGSTTTLTGTATTANGSTVINYWLWTEVSGPSAALITLPSGPTAKVSGLVSGTYVFQLKATDNNWRTSTSQVTVIVNGTTTNLPPVSKPVSSITITLPVNTATLDGSASTDPDGTVASYAWQQSSGPNSATISSPTAATTTIKNLVAGTYTFSLTVTDNLGATNTATETVVVNPAVAVQTPPTVTAGNAQTVTLPVSTATLTGTATGTNGATISSTTWSQTGGPSSATIVSVGNLVTVVNGLKQGTYTFLLSATDNNGQTASSTVTVTVNPVAVAPPPTVSAGNAQTITLPANSVTLAGTASGNGGSTIAATQWTQTSGPGTATIGAAGSLATSASNLVQGTYTFTLTATDNTGQSTSSNVTITVNAAAVAPPPTVSAGSAQTITLPANSVTLTGTATGNGGSMIAATQWTQTGGPGSATIGAAGSLSTAVSNLAQGTYTFTLTASDNTGQSASSNVTVTVNAAPAVPPTVAAGGNQSITLPTNSVTLTGTATGNGGATIVSTLWTETGGPSTATVVTPSGLSSSVTGLVQGSYTFAFTATDNNGQTSTSSMTVSVAASTPPPTYTPPTVNAGSAQTITLPTNSVSLTGTASGTNGATVVSTTWSQIGGPTTATIGTASQLGTTVSGLQQGVYIFLLSASDNNGQAASSYVTITVNAAKKNPPSVNAGVNKKIKLPSNNTTLAGTVSANDGGTIVATQWSQVGGPSTATIASASSLTPTVSSLLQGDYVFQLSAQDDQGSSASSYVTVEVDPADLLPPTVSAGAAQNITLPTNSVTLTGSAAAQGSANLVTTTWTELGGPAAATIVSGGQLSTSVTNLVQGSYTFQLTVMDNNNQTSSSTVTVTVAPAAVTITPPTVSATATSITLPTTTSTLTGTASGTNGATIATIQWSQTQGPTQAQIQSPTSLTTGVSNLISGGVYTFQLTVVDSHGQLSSTTVNLTVSYPQNPPTVNAGNTVTIIVPANSATLEGSAIAAQGATIASTLWYQASGPTVATIATPDNLACTMGGLQAGVYVFSLRATDNNGRTATDQVTVNVIRPAVNIPPIANPGVNQTFTLTGSDTTINLDGSASYDPDGTIVSYTWYQLSGKAGVTIGNSNTATPTIHGMQVGTYVFVLVVKDNGGATTQAEVTITINAPAGATLTDPSLIANAGKDTIIALPANTVQLNGAGSSDGTGSIAGYRWEKVSGPEGMTLQSPDAASTEANNLVAGLYMFRLTVTNQKGDTASAVVKVTVMSDTRSAKDTSGEKFFLFPNPAHDHTTLTMTGDASGTVELHLFDINGKPVKGLSFSKLPGTSSVTIDVSQLASGMYIIHASYGNNQTQQIKLMKQ
jgi:alpha-tubulin suppressor-like RCC1 family protein